ncbi:amidohydrolase [Pisolithus sp. B1]|nr:amidohydrolase [Pisolithus sp. B1]
MSHKMLDDHNRAGCLPLKRLWSPLFGRLSSKRSPANIDPRNSSEESEDHDKQPSLDRPSTLANSEPMRFESCCDFSASRSLPTTVDPPPKYLDSSSSVRSMSTVMTVIESTMQELDEDLRTLSLQIHDHPELMFEERYAHDTLCDFMESHGFAVTRHYLGLDTAWRAQFTHGKGGRTLGINSEMDALPVIGHACGHNLIAVSGAGVAIAVKSALQTYDVPGTVVLLGTPGEEGGAGKAMMLERGGYRDMDACLMCHPSAGPTDSVSLGSCLAMQALEAEFYGQSAHAGNAPWDGTNALDAAFLAYSSISVLRQQIKPDHRIHGVANGLKVIPDYAGMRWLVRAPTKDQLSALVERVKACFEGAALATSCRLKLTEGLPYHDLRQNNVLGKSSPRGNVSYEMPSLHPSYAIPTVTNGGNHTPAFAESARSTEAHKATMTVSKGLAWTGFRIIADDEFFQQVGSKPSCFCPEAHPPASLA